MNRPRSSSVTRKEFSQCALVEIIHLHDCLRGALHEIQSVVNSLVEYSSCIDDDVENSWDKKETKQNNDGGNKMENLSNTVYPISSSSSSSSSRSSGNNPKKIFKVHIASDLAGKAASRFHLIWSVFQAHSGAEDEFIWPALKVKLSKLQADCCDDQQPRSEASSLSSVSRPQCPCAATLIGQEQYEEDHVKEEAMFKQIISTLRRLKGSFRYYHVSGKQTGESQKKALYIIRQAILLLKKQTDSLTQHLQKHLKKEETECLPIVKAHLSNKEISTLVGNIMGKRSAEVMTKILNLALCTLPAEERTAMVTHMKNAMEGTFFEKWLEMGGWDGGHEKGGIETNPNIGCGSRLALQSSFGPISLPCGNLKRQIPKLPVNNEEGPQIKIMRNSLSRHPSKWYREDENGQNSLVWCCSSPESTDADILSTIPAFTESELTPTFHFSSTQGGPVLGCKHYARACKLRHPATGMLHTCRLCFQDLRESTTTQPPAYLHTTITDSSRLPVLHRNAISEVLCMRCGALQPANEFCINPDCYPKQPLARYFCSICKLYDDAPSKDIYHCPYCNACRKGKGLGIDFRHCMRCNACVSIDEYEGHACIPQRLQGNCPICKEELFESTVPLTGMKCGHVMHLSCFNSYLSSCSSSGKIKCPLCNMVFDSLRG